MSSSTVLRIHKRDEEDRKFLLEFIAVYKQLPSLWNVKSSEYSDRFKKSRDYDILLEKFQERYPEASKSDMKKKINSIRTNYRREVKRLGELGEQNEATLWYFNELSFIHDSEAVTTVTYNNDDPLIPTPLPLTREAPVPQMKVVDETEERKAKKKKRDPADELLNLAAQRLRQEPDMFKKIADNWASKLRQMNAMQQLYAEKFINDILFEGVLGNLTRHSVQINTNPLISPTPTPCNIPQNIPDASYINSTDDSLDTKEFILSERLPTAERTIRSYMSASPSNDHMQDEDLEINETKYQIGTSIDRFN